MSETPDVAQGEAPISTPIPAEGSAAPPIPPRRRWGRARLEVIAMAIMALGAMMMFQPFALPIYSYSFIVILAGTVMFTIVSHFRD